MGTSPEEFSKGKVWRASILIFVSAGTQEKPFNRLIEGVDKIADLIGERVLAQIGYATYLPKRCEFFRFCSREEMLSHINAASMVIAQSGFGIIGDSIKLMKPLILVPRELRFGEAIDKQYELAEYLASRHESIICIRNIELMADAVRKIRTSHVDYNYKTVIPDLIDSFITQVFYSG